MCWANPGDIAASDLLELVLKGILALIRFFQYANKSILSYIITKYAVNGEVPDAVRAHRGRPDQGLGISTQHSPEKLTFGLRSEGPPGANL